MSAMGFIVILAIAIGIFTLMSTRVQQKQRILRQIKSQFGEKPKEREDSIYKIASYHEEMKKMSNGFLIDDITWNDLDMDDIFWRINNTRSYIGEQVLYHHLYLLDEAEEKKELHEKRQKRFWENEEQRMKLEYELARIGKSKDDFYLPSFLLHAIELVPDSILIFRVLQIALVVTFLYAIGYTILFSSGAYFGAFVLVAIINIVVYSLNKLKYETYLNALGSIGGLLSFTKNLQKKKELKQFFMEEQEDGIKQSMKNLKKLQRLVGSLMVKKTSALTGDAFDILRDYIIGMTLWDFTVYVKIMKLIKEYQDDLIVVYEYIGSLDMDIAVASFQKSLPFTCKPVFSDGKKIEVTDLYHPLIDEAIPNDFILEKNCVITGSNASGKSTFLKALAMNAILAQSIQICTAKQMILPRIHIMTSMTVRDDILSGESYYMKEINYLKRMVDESQNGILTLYIIDEILRGTNAKERLAASLSVLNYLQEKNALLIVATHDMPIADTLKESYQCCSFGNYIENEQIIFDYKIHEGFLETKNAIVLLKSAGFPDEIVRNAKAFDEKNSSL